MIPSCRCTINRREYWTALDEFLDFGLRIWECARCGGITIGYDGTQPKTYLKYRDSVISIQDTYEKWYTLTGLREEIRKTKGKRPDPNTSRKMMDCLSVGSDPIIERYPPAGAASDIRPVYRVRPKSEVITTTFVVG